MITIIFNNNLIMCVVNKSILFFRQCGGETIARWYFSYCVHHIGLHYLQSTYHLNAHRPPASLTSSCRCRPATSPGLHIVLLSVPPATGLSEFVTQFARESDKNIASFSSMSSNRSHVAAHLPVISIWFPWTGQGIDSDCIKIDSPLCATHKTRSHEHMVAIILYALEECFYFASLERLTRISSADLSSAIPLAAFWPHIPYQWEMILTFSFSQNDMSLLSLRCLA